MVLFLSVSCAGFAQEGASGAPNPLDRVITIVGADEAALPIPSPWRQQDIVIPEPDLRQPASVVLPAVEPPIGDSSGPSAASGSLDSRAILAGAAGEPGP
jgi:hypothetical protein